MNTYVTQITHKTILRTVVNWDHRGRRNSFEGTVVLVFTVEAIYDTVAPEVTRKTDVTERTECSVRGTHSHRCEGILCTECLKLVFSI